MFGGQAMGNVLLRHNVNDRPEAHMSASGSVAVHLVIASMRGIPNILFNT